MTDQLGQHARLTSGDNPAHKIPIRSVPNGREGLRAWVSAQWTELELRAGHLAPRDSATWTAILETEHWKSLRAPRALPPWALQLFYQTKRLIPRQTQLALRRLLIQRQGSPIFPRWPYEPAGETLLRISFAETMLKQGTARVTFPWFWPDSYNAAAILTHDVESAEGLAYAPTVAAWEEGYGLRSSFNVVSRWYAIDFAILTDLANRGHEIGSHAIKHDRSLFASRKAFDEALPALRTDAKRLGAVGFRSPATHRVVDWLQDLPFEYDCTMPHSDPYEPIPGGVATVWPFFHGPVVELPYTAPQDHTLYNLLGHEDASLWRDQLGRVSEAHGLFQLITHPDPEYLGRPTIASSYREILSAIESRDDLWTPLPRDLARWWAKRASGDTPRDNGEAFWDGTTVTLRPIR